MPGAKRVHFAMGAINYDHSAIKIMLSGETGETAEEVRRRARAVQKRAQYKAPFRTGRLRYSISVNTMSVAEGYVAEITADAPYALMVEFGRRRVEPVEKKWLHWLGNYGDVFAKSAAAVAPVPFMRDALDAAEE